MKIRTLILSAVALAAVALFAPLAVHAQDNASLVTSAATPATSSNAIGDLVAVLAAYVPSWVKTALSIFGTVSIGYQALIAWAHKRAAETADVQDDQWLASLDAKPWFRILDRLFYWGGYLGSRMGGKKL